MATLQTPRLYILLVGLAAAIVGGGVVYTGLSWMGRLDPPPATQRDSSDTELKEKDLEGTTPDRETVHEPTSGLDTLGCVIPSFLASTPDESESEGDEEQRDRPARTDSLSPTIPSGVGVGPTHTPQVDARLTSNIKADGYLLPIVDGVPAVTVTPGLTKAQVYDLGNGRGRVFRWDHPEHTFTIAPAAEFYTTPDAFRVRLGIELDVRMEMAEFRLSGGIEPLPSMPLRPWLSITVRPVSYSFL